MAYPSMSEVSSAMWCEYDDDSDDESSSEDARAVGRRTATTSRSACDHSRHRPPRCLLRALVQTLDGRVCDDEDEDSESDDGESETDGENESDGDDDDNRSRSSGTLGWERRGRSKDPARGISGAGRASREGGRRAGSGGIGTPGSRRSKKKDGEFDEVDCQRKEELASVMRRLRVAIRRMDGALTEEKVWLWMYGRIVLSS